MLADYFKCKNIESRSITQENITGEKGKGGTEENGNKGRPAFRTILAGEEKVLCDMEGPGMIRHIWMTLGRPDTQYRLAEIKRNLIIRMYWEGEQHPSVIAPVGDFFGVAHGKSVHYMSLLLGTPQGLGNQCYFAMPFAKRARITVTNESKTTISWLFYQIDYTVGDEITDDMGRFHAHFRRENPTKLCEDYTLLDVKNASGVYIGAVIGVNRLAPEWWGEGEIKIYLDGDEQYPTICGTGAEDYACVGWGLGHPHDALYSGLNYNEGDINNPFTPEHDCVSFYRFHILDPIYFHSDIKVTLQQMGAGNLAGIKSELPDYPTKGPYKHTNGISSWLFHRVEDVCSCVFWYQRELGTKLPDIPSYEERIAGIELDDPSFVSAKLEGGV